MIYFKVLITLSVIFIINYCDATGVYDAMDNGDAMDICDPDYEESGKCNSILEKYGFSYANGYFNYCNVFQFNNEEEFKEKLQKNNLDIKDVVMDFYNHIKINKFKENDNKIPLTPIQYCEKMYIIIQEIINESNKYINNEIKSELEEFNKNVYNNIQSILSNDINKNNNNIQSILSNDINKNNNNIQSILSQYINKIINIIQNIFKKYIEEIGVHNHLILEKFLIEEDNKIPSTSSQYIFDMDETIPYTLSPYLKELVEMIQNIQKEYSEELNNNIQFIFSQYINKINNENPLTLSQHIEEIDNKIQSTLLQHIEEIDKKKDGAFDPNFVKSCTDSIKTNNYFTDNAYLNIVKTYQYCFKNGLITDDVLNTDIDKDNMWKTTQDFTIYQACYRDLSIYMFNNIKDTTEYINFEGWCMENYTNYVDGYKKNENSNTED